VGDAVNSAKSAYAASATRSLKATVQPIPAIDVPLAYHSVSVVKGRAYLFGGKTTRQDGTGEELASNDVHIVILPASGMESTDYKKIDATEAAPSKRYGHASAVIEERIYIFGGCGEDWKPLEENGRVWVFDTASNKWSNFDPPSNSPYPSARLNAAAVASEHPRPVQQRHDENVMPQQPPDPETTMPEIADPDTYGTVIVAGGRSGNDVLNDTWTFDISTRTWKQLPDPPAPPSSGPGLALVKNRLYLFAAGQISFLGLTKSSFDDRWGQGELGLAPLGPWQSLATGADLQNELKVGDRAGAGLIPITTGQGRLYLVLVGGESQAGDALEDIWALQVNPEGMSTASFTDAAWQAVRKDSEQAQWHEVRYHNADGVGIQETQPGRGIGVRKGVAVASGSDFDEASLLVWGGMGADGKPRRDGVMVTLE
jgi:hypothetical protein